MTKKYQFKFFFDFGSGGCLWPSNEEALDNFDSPADAIIKELDGKVIYNPLDKLNISKETLNMIEQLDEKYYNYLNQDNPTDTVILDKEAFLDSAKKLFNKIQKELEKDCEIIWSFDI